LGLYCGVAWIVRNHDAFDSEFDALPVEVQDELLAMTALLEVYGPGLGRPHADTLAGSKHANGVWRVAFAFDPERQAILLVAGDKAGVAQKRFYKGLVAKADSRFTGHLKALKET
jgi:hypothetical protein